MNVSQFVEINNLKPGDAVVVKKDGIGLLDHYLIYLGEHIGEHKFIANYTRGTRILSYNQLFDFAREYSPRRIRRFLGNEVQRHAAVVRALSRRDQNSYHLLLNNCEHFANFTQKGKAYSQQTTTFGAGMTFTGLAVAASAKSDAGRGVGAAMTVLGLLTLMMDND